MTRPERPTTELPSHEDLWKIFERFGNRRTVARSLVEECLGLTERALSEHQLQWKATLDATEKESDRLIQIERTRAERAEARVRELEASRSVSEAQRSTPGGVEVTFTVPSACKDWSVGGIEALAYRLRVAGGSDDTPVKFLSRTATSIVPFPELAPESPLEKLQSPVSDDLTPHQRWRAEHPVKRDPVAIVMFAFCLGVAVVQFVRLLV